MNKTTMSVTPKGAVVTRLIAGVELKMQATGKSWTLSAKPVKK